MAKCQLTKIIVFIVLRDTFLMVKFVLKKNFLFEHLAVKLFGIWPL